MTTFKRLKELVAYPVNQINYIEYKQLFEELAEMTNSYGISFILSKKDKDIQQINKVMKELVLIYE